MAAFENLRTVADCERELANYPPLTPEEINKVQELEDKTEEFTLAELAAIAELEVPTGRASKQAKDIYASRVAALQCQYEGQRNRLYRLNPDLADLQTRDRARMSIAKRKLQLVSNRPPPTATLAAMATDATGAAAGPGLWQDGPSVRAVLASSVSPATTSVWEASGSTLGVDFQQPSVVSPWEHADPEANDQQDLNNTIINHQENFTITPPPRLQPLKQDAVELNSEADVSSELHIRVCKDVLEVLARGSHPLDANVLWSQQPPAAILKSALFRTEVVGIHADNQQAAVEAAAAHISVGSCSNSGWRKADLVLQVMVVQLAAAAGAAPQAKRRKVALIGEVKRIARLMESNEAPVDLLEAYQNTCHRFHGQAREAIGQIYTYMLTWTVCHGFISCWSATWLVYLPPIDRRHMYISRPFLATAASGTNRCPTMMGALSWQQQQALHLAFTHQHVAPWCSPATAAAGGGQGASGGGGGHGGPDANDGSSGSAPQASYATGTSDSSYSPSAVSLDQAASSYALLQRGTVAGEPSGPTSGTAATTVVAGATSAAPAPAASVRLQFLGELAQGGDGTVFTGTCDGAPAVIKVYTWEARALAAYWRELKAYLALAPLQGSVVPYVLAHGQLPTGLRFMVLRPVEGGQQLSDHVRPFTRTVTAAALRALQEVQAVCPGFVHGDVRLENIMMVPGAPGCGGAVEVEASGALDGASGGGGAVRCVLLDFAQSRMDGDEQQQEQERVHLQQLLGMAAGE